MMWDDKRFHSLNYFLKHTYGEKIYRLALDGGMTCPNRDGTIDSRGCIFCSAGGSGDFAASRRMSITDQLAQAKEKLSAKIVCNHYIAYFQAYTNTYESVDYLREIFMEAISSPDILILSIATRPDCLSQEILDLLDELNHIKPVWIELGLQSIHEDTASYIRRGYTLPVFEEAVASLRARNITVITHVILGLPTEDHDRNLETIKYLSHMDIQGIKLQLLHILKGCDLGREYVEHPFPLPTLDEYCNLIADCLELLPHEMVIHRITGDGPRDLMIAPLWSTNKKNVLNQIQRTLKIRNTYQGRLYKE